MEFREENEEKVTTTWYEKANIVYGHLNDPLCAVSSCIYKYSNTLGWVDYTNEFKRLCYDTMGMRTGDDVFKWFKHNFQLKNFSSDDMSVYYEWVIEKEYFKGEWKNFYLKEEEFLFGNGIFNLKTWEFEPFLNEEGIHTRIIFGPTSSIMFDDDFLSLLIELKHNGFSVLNSDVQNLISFIFEGKSQDYTWNFFEKISCILQPHNHIKKEFYFYGLPNTLKTTLAKALAYAIAGRKGVSELTQDELVRDKWAPSNLLNKYVNISDDSPANRKWIPFMKSLTGKGSFLFERKNHDPISVPLTCKFINCTNELPHSEEGDAVKNRIEIFEFTNVKKRGNSIDQDKYITAAYWQDIERRKSMLALLLVAANRLYERGEYLEVKEYIDTREELLNEIDPIEETLLDTIKEGEQEDFVPVSYIMAMAFNNNQDRALQMKVKEYIKTLFPNAKRKRFENKRGYTGIKLIRVKKDEDLFN